MPKALKAQREPLAEMIDANALNWGSAVLTKYRAMKVQTETTPKFGTADSACD